MVEAGLPLFTRGARGRDCCIEYCLAWSAQTRGQKASDPPV